MIKLQEAKKGFVLLPRRWVVERSFGWAMRSLGGWGFSGVTG
ncbi:transposase [Xanthomonas fragariae LMG 25863]|nr:transposase [Xanthomonas fragariae LMG 25863]